MRIKEKAISALAVMTAAVTFSAFAANASVLGESGTSVEFEYNHEITEVSCLFDSLHCTVAIHENALPEAGTYKFSAHLVADQELENLFVQGLPVGTNVDYMELFDLSFTNESGETVSPDNVLVTISSSYNRSYNAAFVYENGKFVPLSVDNENGFSFVAPHCSRFMIAQLTSIGEPISSEPEIIDESSITDKHTTDTTKDTTNRNTPKPDNGDVKTGDNANTTAALFAVLSAAALSAAIVSARKGKKQEN